MTEELKNRTPDARVGDQRSGQQQAEQRRPPCVSAQAQRDEEIEEIQKRSKHQPPAIQAPPEASARASAESVGDRGRSVAHIGGCRRDYALAEEQS